MIAFVILFHKDSQRLREHKDLSVKLCDLVNLCGITIKHGITINKKPLCHHWQLTCP